MRSNIARTWVSGSVPAAGSALMPLVPGLERGDVGDQLVEFLGIGPLERPEGRHRRGRVDQRAGDRVLAQPVADVRQVRTERVAVLADLEAAQATRGRGDVLALLVLGLGLQGDLRGR